MTTISVDQGKLRQGTVKVCPVVLRQLTGLQEILVFRHPTAGIQLVKGTLEPNESVVEGALRELDEESGITEVTHTAYLGKFTATYQQQEWHLILCEAEKLPDSWSFFTQDEGGLVFNFLWHPVEKQPGEEWHELFVEALAAIRTCL